MLTNILEHLILVTVNSFYLYSHALRPALVAELRGGGRMPALHFQCESCFKLHPSESLICVFQFCREGHQELKSDLHPRNPSLRNELVTQSGGRVKKRCYCWAGMGTSLWVRQGEEHLCVSHWPGMGFAWKRELAWRFLRYLLSMAVLDDV